MSRVSSAKHELSIQYWKKLIEAQQVSELSVKDWCDQNGISRDAYYYWLRIVRERAIDNLPAQVKNSLAIEDEKPAAFKRLEVESPLHVFQPAVVIHLNGATVEVPNGANRETVEAVLLALKTTC